MKRISGIGLLLAVSVFLAGCQSPECYSAADCANGSTCCSGTCTGVAPLPLGSPACTEGCQCQSFVEGEIERAICFTYEGAGTTQCTITCNADEDCVAGSGAIGHCLTRDEAAIAERVCVWEAP